MKKQLPILLIFLFALNSAWGQIESEGKPLSFEGVEKPDYRVPFLEYYCQFKAKKAIKLGEKHFKSKKFAELIELDIDFFEHAQLSVVNGREIWRLGLRSAGAYSLGIRFSAFKLPDGAALFTYTPDGSVVYGAFTEKNNKKYGKFAIRPLPGDELVIEYNRPENSSSETQLQLLQLIHDYTNILKSDRRPLGISGECNKEVNCPEGAGWRREKNAVVRLLVGDELCSGVLVNNTAANQLPYLLTAHHCIEDPSIAEGTIIYFNYENPACGIVDGDPSHTISGSTLLSTASELDFSLIELSSPVPDTYMPYYAGWETAIAVPDSTVSIHHPQGDNKKISVDVDQPGIDSYDYGFEDNAFWLIHEWDIGTTEGGSSGAPLFDDNHRVIGTLTGGSAYCGNSVEDYFAMLPVYWDRHPEEYKQLKKWLDPLNTGQTNLEGLWPFEEEDYCDAFVNVDAADEMINGQLDGFSGYVTGTNNNGWQEFAEHFTNTKEAVIHTIGLGISEAAATGVSGSATVKIYRSDTGKPGIELCSKSVLIDDLYPGAVNFIDLNEPVTVFDDYFVSFSVENNQDNQVALYYSNDANINSESYKIKDSGGEWHDAPTLIGGDFKGTLLMEVHACQISSEPEIPDFKELFRISPNPATTLANIQVNRVNVEKIAVYDLLGNLMNVSVGFVDAQNYAINISGLRRGIYVVKVTAEGTEQATKLVVLGEY